MIRMLDPTRLADDERALLREAFDRVLEGGSFILGPEVERFEQEIAAFLGVRHAIGVSSGTDALIVSLLSLGVGPGDEVICPAYTFFATAGAIARVGATPVFADVELHDFMSSAEAIAARIGPRTRAIVAVHLFGQAAEIDRMLDWGVPVVEDAAQAIGATLGGRRVGSFGALGAFSFFPSKNLAALGDGGLVTTNDDDLAEKARTLRVHGARRRNHHELLGGNYRLDALQAAALRVRLPRLGDRTARRVAIAERYREGLRAAGVGVANEGQFIDRDADRDDVVLLPRVVRGEHVHNQFVVRVAARVRDPLRATLLERGIETAVYYPEILPHQPCFAHLPDARAPFGGASTAAAETIALPIDPALREDEIDTVIATIARGCDGARRR
ncbi:MAG: DegT/DnrJ/EryC1/StrS family aminotransferase [Deltaproteobacteria bacterium]|nr:DegT/DnrJ/EryC1/StrS family aminotransferase [Deltaproteobacteria bacterium]